METKDQDILDVIQPAPQSAASAYRQMKEAETKAKTKSTVDKAAGKKDTKHTKDAVDGEGMDDKESGEGNKFIDLHTDELKVNDDDSKGADDAAKAGKVVKQAASRNGSDNLNNGDGKTPKKVKEEAEDLDELSKSTLGSYVKKASRSVRASTSLRKDFDDEKYRNMKVANDNHPNNINGKKKDPKKLKKATRDMNTNDQLSKHFKNAARNRITGISRAIDKLTKEEMSSESVEDFRERMNTKLYEGLRKR